MQLISKYVRENKRYSKSDLKQLFVLSEVEFSDFVGELVSMNVLKKHDPENLDENQYLLDEDMPNSSNSSLYYFRYVGILLCKKRVIKVYPKCFVSISEPVNDKSNRPDEQMKLVLDVIQKYNNKKAKSYHEQNADRQKVDNNLLGLMVYLLGDYFENGLYSNAEEINEINGEGPINWTRTINECVPLIRNDIPYYVDTYTIRNKDNENDYLRLLHAYILTECSRQIEEARIGQLLGFERVEISDDSFNDFGQISYVLYRIKQEQNIQYETRKQQVLKAMYAYIDEQHDSKISNQTDSFRMYGTTAFNKVWENICQEVFEDKLHVPIKDLPISLLPGENGDVELINLIEKPKWVTGATTIYAKKTFEPDIITISNINGIQTFAIMDAKYYNLQLEQGKPLKGNPGVEDLAKQYLYQLAYHQFIVKHNILDVKNCFLLPTDKSDKVLVGYAELDMLSGLNLQNIKIRLLPINYMMQLYLANEVISISYLELDK